MHLKLYWHFIRTIAARQVWRLRGIVSSVTTWHNTISISVTAIRPSRLATATKATFYPPVHILIAVLLVGPSDDTPFSHRRRRRRRVSYIVLIMLLIAILLLLRRCVSRSILRRVVPAGRLTGRPFAIPFGRRMSRRTLFVSYIR